MNPGKPTFQTLLRLIDDMGCPGSGELPSSIQVLGPDAIVLEGCGHVLDAREWADEAYRRHPLEGDSD